MTTIVTHILIFKPAHTPSLLTDLLQYSKIDTQMIDQLQFCLLVNNTLKERRLGIGYALQPASRRSYYRCRSMTYRPIHDETDQSSAAHAPGGRRAFSSA